MNRPTTVPVQTVATRTVPTCASEFSLSDLRRLVEKVDFGGNQDDCWLWVGAKSNGYGRFWDGHDAKLAHRIVYELLVGSVPGHLFLDHLCRIPGCVNPAHLEPVTNKENLLRGNTLNAANAAKTHCQNGHRFDEENTYRRPNGVRECRTCARERQRVQPSGVAR